MNPNNGQLDKVKLIDWCNEDIMPILKNCVDDNLSNVTLDISVPKDCHYLSTVYFLNINTEDENKCIYTVIKKPNETSPLNKILNPYKLFHNEALFYKKVACYNKQFPKCYYSSVDEENINNTLIILENIETLGFKICPSLYDIPFEYVISGVQELARFHGMGYTMKINKRSTMEEIIKDIEEAKYTPDNFYSTYFNLISKRPIKWLREQNYDEKFCNKMEHYMKNAYQYFILDLIKPMEPLAVICHGDFTRNNILFRKTNEVIEPRLIDFAMMRYASPGIDLSTFLYYSVSKNDRKKRFNEIFKAYHDALIKYLDDEHIKIIDCFSYDNLLADYKHHVMFGYIIAICFLPNFYGICKMSNAMVASNYDPAKTYTVSNIGNSGGDELSKRFAKMLIEIRELGGLDHLED